MKLNNNNPVGDINTVNLSIFTKGELKLQLINNPYNIIKEKNCTINNAII